MNNLPTLRTPVTSAGRSRTGRRWINLVDGYEVDLGTKKWNQMQIGDPVALTNYPLDLAPRVRLARMTLRELLKTPGCKHQLTALLLTSVVIFEDQPETELQLLRRVLPLLLRHLARDPSAVLGDLPTVLRDLPPTVVTFELDSDDVMVLHRWGGILQKLVDSPTAHELVERLTAQEPGTP